MVIYLEAPAYLCQAYPFPSEGLFGMVEWLLNTADGHWTEYHLHSKWSGPYT